MLDRWLPSRSLGGVGWLLVERALMGGTGWVADVDGESDSLRLATWSRVAASPCCKATAGVLGHMQIEHLMTEAALCHTPLCYIDIAQRL